MFHAHCHAEDRTVLLTERRITGIDLDHETVTIRFTCWCGAQGEVVDHRPTAAVAAA